MKAHQFFGEGEIRSVPRTQGEMVSIEGFMACPCSFLMANSDPIYLLGAQEIYRLAYERAKACAAPPWHVRNLLAGVN